MEVNLKVNKESIVSAQIILRPASGQTIDGNVVISASNITEFAPSPDAVSSIAAEFRSRGFEIGPLVGISFSVTGTIRAFEGLFGIRIRLGKDHGLEFVVKNKIIGHELSGEELPEDFRQFVHAVAFPLPPDFGPTEFHP
jgi:hypothetical protein